MSEEDVEIVRRGLEVMNSIGLDRWSSTNPGALG